MQRLAVFSHSCVVPANREFFECLGKSSELLIVCPKKWKGSLIRGLESKSEAGTVAYPVVFSGNGSLFFYRSRLAEVKRFRPDVVFVDEEPWSLAALQIYLQFPRAKKVFYTKQNLAKKVPPPFRWIERFIFRASAAAFTISGETSAVLKWKGFTGKAVPLPHALDPRRFRRFSAEEKREVRGDFGLPEQKFLAGYFGRLTPEKGIEDLFAAAEQELPRNPDLALVLVGNGPLFARAQELERKFPGQFFVRAALPHDQVQRLLAAMSITILPSRTTPRWKEQFGRVIIESAACGVPVVGSDSGEIPHVIAAAGCGITFPEGSVPELTRAIRKFQEDDILRATAAEEGSRVVRALYTHEAVAESLLSELTGAVTNA